MATANPALKRGDKYGDLKRRLWFLLGALVVYRIGTHIPVPGINPTVLEELFPDAVLAESADAFVLGLNAVSDGRHVVVADGATRLQEQLRERGYVPVPVDLSELLKGGGGVKCCTSELR